MAAVYEAFGEPTGAEAHAEIAKFFVQVVGAKRSAFQGAVQNRQIRTRTASPQAPSLLLGFEREASVGLIEGRAVLDKQRVAIQNRPAYSVIATKYVVDTCVFNWLADELIRKEDLPSDGGFAITHVQVDEISATKEDKRRIRLWLVQTDLHCKLLPTETFALDVSRLDHSKWGDGKLFMALKQELDTLNRGKANNARDALIAETAIANAFTLITADGHLKLAAERHGGSVLFFPAPAGRNS
jgi:predicted nucleic acid-binding protein